MTEFSSLQILQSGCNPRHLNSRAFLDCSGLHLDYMDYKVIKWIAEQYNPKQSKGNLCNPNAIHCNLGLQFCFAIQINLCNLTAIQEDCSLIAEIAVRLLRLQKFRNLLIHIPAPNKVSGKMLGVLFWLLRLQSDCWDCSQIAEIAVRLLRLQKFRNLLIHIPAPNKVSGKMLGVLFWLLRLQSDCWDCSQIAEIAVWLLRLQS